MYFVLHQRSVSALNFLTLWFDMTAESWASLGYLWLTSVEGLVWRWFSLEGICTPMEVEEGRI